MRPMRSALASTVTMSRFFSGSRHQLSSCVPHALFTARTSEWKKRSEHHVRIANEISPEPSRDCMKLCTVARTVSALPRSTMYCESSSKICVVACSRFPRNRVPAVISSTSSGSSENSA